MRSATLMPDVEETSDLSKSLEEKLQAALEQAGGAASDVVLVLDLDETLFTPLAADGLATSVWFEDLLKRWAPRLRDADGMTSEDTLEQALAVVDRFYARVPVGPTDPSLGGLLNWCRSEGVVSIGLTARRPALAAVTWEQVGDRVPLDFNSQALPLGPDTIHRADGQVPALQRPLRSRPHSGDVGGPLLREGRVVHGERQQGCGAAAGAAARQARGLRRRQPAARSCREGRAGRTRRFCVRAPLHGGHRCSAEEARSAELRPLAGGAPLRAVLAGRPRGRRPGARGAAASAEVQRQGR
ncbi:unnamed protein product, partial [Prorocentrum cordatum]